MNCRACRIAVLLALVWTHAAATGAEVALERMTSPELRAAVAAGTTTALIPIGGTEQNGAHMVLGKHNVRAKALAAQVARALGDALVAPVVAYVPEGGIDPPTGHMRYPGTITVAPDAYRAVLASAARSFRRHGFRTIVLLGDHGDYQKDNQAVAAALTREWAGTGVRVVAVAEYYRAATTGYAQALKARGYADGEIGLHAGLADTSLALAVDPRLVRTERLAVASPGVSGDPRRASAELGQAGVDAIVAQTVEAVRAAKLRR